MKRTQAAVPNFFLVSGLFTLLKKLLKTPKSFCLSGLCLLIFTGFEIKTEGKRFLIHLKTIIN